MSSSCHSLVSQSLHLDDSRFDREMAQFMHSEWRAFLSFSQSLQNHKLVSVSYNMPIYCKPKGKRFVKIESFNLIGSWSDSMLWDIKMSLQAYFTPKSKEIAYITFCIKKMKTINHVVLHCNIIFMTIKHSFPNSHTFPPSLFWLMTLINIIQFYKLQ